ncbi:hypothetical protein OEZ86_012828 [Tetradesmus obliquus]|nr:hypothetical protein OEZ86_012828 [Tetradesmus obliquus]
MDLDVAADLSAQPSASGAAGEAAAAEDEDAVDLACKQPKNSKQATKANHQPPKRRPRNSGNSGNSGSNKKKDWALFLHTPETLAAAKRDPNHKYLCMITEEGLAQLQASFGQQRAKDWDDVLQRVQPWVTDVVRERLAGLAQQPEA